MNIEKFKTETTNFIDNATELLHYKKAKEYSGNHDRLKAFKEAGKLLNCQPETALKGFLTKHIISIYDLLEKLENNSLYIKCNNDLEIWQEKLTDILNYCLLLWALLTERVSSENKNGEDKCQN